MGFEVRKTAVVGAGVMGGEIAYVLSAGGFPVMLKDVDAARLEAGVEKARAIYSFRVKRRRIAQDEMDSRMSLIKPRLDYEGFESADLVIEAVPEDLELKKRVFAELDGICPPPAVLASNTSALSITALASAAEHRQRIAGFHFFSPASMMRLVEVIGGESTSEETVGRLRGFAAAIGKTPVRVRDSAGFIVNRLLCAAMLEALRCEEEGLASRAEIDSFLVKPDAGLPTGLFRMADQLGVDLVVHVMETIEKEHGARFRPPEILKRLVREGNLGVKTGKGFYEYGR
ncbi:MAG: 3-hydroxyacyl-CoA dehydrogenase family protein [bacterium]